MFFDKTDLYVNDIDLKQQDYLELHLNYNSLNNCSTASKVFEPRLILRHSSIIYLTLRNCRVFYMPYSFDSSFMVLCMSVFLKFI